MQEPPAPADYSRVILHIDEDCFYAQVEMKRLGIPRETPCAVQQWEGLIAVNYPARACGVTRHMRVKEAKKVCPELVLVHVETIGAEGRDSGAADAGPEPAGGVGGGAQDSRRLTQKACLERYRLACAEVVALLHRLAPAAVIEKASIDEVYMDVTAMVDKELQDRNRGHVSSDAFSWGSVVVGGPLDPSSEVERRLAEGARIACRLRGKMLEELGFTSSAGISTNKLLSKIGSAMNKPNQQTIIPPRSVALVLQDLPLGKLRGFGGKLGEQLEALGCTTVGQVQALPHATLVSHFGAERALSIEQAVRGVSHEPVQERERPKSMLAAKSFSPTSDLAALQGWFAILAQELAARMVTDEAQFRRRPKNLVVHFRGGPHMGSDRSKCCPMPRFGPSGPSADVIAEAAFSLFRTKCAAEAIPCNRLAISAADFTDLPGANGSAITRFLVPKAPAAAGAAGDAGAAGAGGAGVQQAPLAQSPRSAEHSGQKVEQLQQQQQGGGKHARQGSAPAAGLSISSLFERAHKRQRASTPEPHGQLEEQQEQQREQEQQRHQRPSGSPGAAEHGKPAAPPRPQQAPHAVAKPASPGAPPLVVQPLAGPQTVQPAAPAATSREASVAADGCSSREDAEAAGLAGVDVEEQRRILRDLEMLQRLNRSKPSSAPGGGGRGGGAKAARPGAGSKAGGRQQQKPGGGQPGILGFFAKPG
ncbi:hypothetical protein ABPG77_002160 [Micractinium sp. CCAP 211/92]